MGKEEGANPEMEVVIGNEFEEDLFSPSKEKTKQTRSQKQAARHSHFTEGMRMPPTKHPLDIPTEEFHQLQEEDCTLEGICRAARGDVSTAGVGFFKCNGVIYRRRTPPGREAGEMFIDQLVLPCPCRQTVLQVLHSTCWTHGKREDSSAPAATLLMAYLVQRCG